MANIQVQYILEEAPGGIFLPCIKLSGNGFSYIFRGEKSHPEFEKAKAPLTLMRIHAGLETPGDAEKLRSMDETIN